MRVTQNSNYDTVRESVRRAHSRLEGLQNQAATLKKVNAPSDDPIGSSKILQIRTDKINNEQFQMNSRLAESFLALTDQALDDLANTMVRAKEIAINQSSGASSTAETRVGVAEEVKQLYEQTIAASSRKIGERNLFSGYKTGTQSVDGNGNYQGDLGQIMVEISKDVFLPINLPGAGVFNTSLESSADFRRLQRGPEGAPEEQVANRGLASVGDNTGDDLPAGGLKQNLNVFEELQALRIGLLSGDLDIIRSTLENFDSLHGHLMSLRAKVGSRMSGIQSNQQALERGNITNAILNSNLEDADMTQVLSEMAKEETVFRSSLQSSRHLIQPTLMDFLK